MAELWGGETRKAVENFPVSGERVPIPVVRWLGRIKGAAARVNADLGLLDPALAERIAAAGDAIAAGEHDDQFPIDVFQTGSGTSSNMNANEVIANLAGDGAHANDHVNMGQSSNDVFPSAVHAAALQEIVERLLPALDHLGDAFAAKAEEFADIVKAGRTHLMDAVPVTLGQEFGGYAAQVRQGRDRVADTTTRLGQLPLGGTATGTGLNTHAEFAERVRARLSADTGLTAVGARRPVRGAGRPRRPGRGLRRAQGGRGLPDQDRQRHRLAGLRPAVRPGRDLPARAPEGLVDHAGQGQPGDPRGRHAGVRPGDRQRRRDHDRRPAGQLRAQRAHPAARAQPAGLDPPAHHHVAPVRRQVRVGHRGRTSRGSRTTPRARSPWPPRSTRTSATTRRRRS